jgi:hypothetical protein
MSSPSTAKVLAQLNFMLLLSLYMRTIEEISATQYEGLRAQPLPVSVAMSFDCLGRRQRLRRTGTEVDDCVCAMGEHHPAQTAAIRRGTWHGDKRLAVI